MIEIQLQRLPHGEGLPAPSYATDGAAGLDVVAAEELTLVPGQRVTMRRSEPFGGPLTVDVEGNEHAISRELAERIGVS